MPSSLPSSPSLLVGALSRSPSLKILGHRSLRRQRPCLRLCRRAPLSCSLLPVALSLASPLSSTPKNASAVSVPAIEPLSFGCCSVLLDLSCLPSLKHAFELGFCSLSCFFLYCFGLLLLLLCFCLACCTLFWHASDVWKKYLKKKSELWEAKSLQFGICGNWKMELGLILLFTSTCLNLGFTVLNSNFWG